MKVRQITAWVVLQAFLVMNVAWAQGPGVSRQTLRALQAVDGDMDEELVALLAPPEIAPPQGQPIGVDRNLPQDLPPVPIRRVTSEIELPELPAPTPTLRWGSELASVSLAHAMAGLEEPGPWRNPLFNWLRSMRKKVHTVVLLSILASIPMNVAAYGSQPVSPPQQQPDQQVLLIADGALRDAVATAAVTQPPVTPQQPQAQVDQTEPKGVQPASPIQALFPNRDDMTVVVFGPMPRGLGESLERYYTNPHTEVTRDKDGNRQIVSGARDVMTHPDGKHPRTAEKVIIPRDDQRVKVVHVRLDPRADAVTPDPNDRHGRVGEVRMSPRLAEKFGVKGPVRGTLIFEIDTEMDGTSKVTPVRVPLNRGLRPLLDELNNRFVERDIRHDEENARRAAGWAKRSAAKAEASAKAADALLEEANAIESDSPEVQTLLEEVRKSAERTKEAAQAAQDKRAAVRKAYEEVQEWKRMAQKDKASDLDVNPDQIEANLAKNQAVLGMYDTARQADLADLALQTAQDALEEAQAAAAQAQEPTEPEQPEQPPADVEQPSLNPWPWLLAALAAAGVIGTTWYLMSRRGRETRPAAKKEATGPTKDTTTTTVAGPSQPEVTDTVTAPPVAAPPPPPRKELPQAAGLEAPPPQSVPPPHWVVPRATPVAPPARLGQLRLALSQLDQILSGAAQPHATTQDRALVILPREALIEGGLASIARLRGVHRGMTIAVAGQFQPGEITLLRALDDQLLFLEDILLHNDISGLQALRQAETAGWVRPGGPVRLLVPTQDAQRQSRQLKPQAKLLFYWTQPKALTLLDKLLQAVYEDLSDPGRVVLALDINAWLPIDPKREAQVNQFRRAWEQALQAGV